MKPSFALLLKGYPLQSEYLRDLLFEHLGWPDLIGNPAFKDTCAIRMSVALAAAGFPVPGGWLRIKAGPLAGKAVECSQHKLSETLKQMWGQPEVYRNNDTARRGIGNRTGVVSFFSIHGRSGGSQGHIDLVQPAGHGFHVCAMSCYFESVEIWFWALL